MFRWSQDLAVTTDAEGRFRLTGIGRERVVSLWIEGPTIATAFADIHARTRPGPTYRLAQQRDKPEFGTLVFHGATFDYVAAPTRPIEGTSATRTPAEPLAGISIRSERFAGNVISGRDHVRTTTGADGRYRLVGDAAGERQPDHGQPRPGAALPRGRRRGPRRSGPRAGHGRLRAQARRGDPREGHRQGDGSARAGHRRILRLRRQPPPSRGAAGSTGEKSGPVPTARSTWSACPAAAWSQRGPRRTIISSATVPTRSPEPTSKAGSGPIPTSATRNASTPSSPSIPPRTPAHSHCDLALDPGMTLSGTVVGPDGRPLAGCTAIDLCPHTMSFNIVKLASDAFTARALDPKQPRPLVFRHDEKKLAAVLVARGDEKGPLTVHLQPAGTVTGRLLDPDGQPRRGVRISVGYAKGQFGPRYYSPLQDPRPDDDGRFRIEGLIPGVAYDLGARNGNTSFGTFATGLKLQPGETRDLGDVKAAQAP